jgi:transposase
MGRPRKGRPTKYPPEFRAEAVELVKRSSDRSIVEIARDLGVSDSTLSNWVRADREAQARAADPEGLSESEREELKRLRRENVDLRMDREILRKAAAYFARETMR